LALQELTAAIRAEDWPLVVRALGALVDGLEGVLLYGSRSRAEQHPHSDYDLLVLAKRADDGLRREVDGLDLDIEVVDQTLFDEPLPGRLYLSPGRLLHDERGRLGQWLARLSECRSVGPQPWSPARRLRHAAWLRRMLRRSSAEGTVAALRRAQLAGSLPETAVELLGHWPGGPLQDLQLLDRHWPELAAALGRWAGAESVVEQLSALTQAVRLCQERLV